MTENRGAGFQVINKTIRRGNPSVQMVLGPECIKIIKVGKDRSTSEDGVGRSTGESGNGPDRQKRKSSRIPNYWGRRRREALVRDFGGEQSPTCGFAAFMREGVLGVF